MTKHYVEFYFVGAFFSETTVEEIETRSMNLTLPKGSFGYSFFDQEEVILARGEVLRGDRKNESGMIYYGKEYSVDDLKREFPNERTLISNVEGNGFKYAVKTIMGNWQPVGENDIVINN